MAISFLTLFPQPVRLAILASVGLIFSCLMAPLAYAQIPLESDDWKLHAERDNIKIYTKKHNDSNFQAFKAIALLNSPITNIMAVMANPHSCVEWVHGCIESWGFDQESFRKRYAYSVNDLPWPVQDRDYVLEINTSNNAATGEFSMSMYAVSDKRPKNPKYVRVTVAETHYTFRPQGEDKTEMIWLQHTEPGGSIPSWLVNALIVDIPIKSMKSLEKVANSEKYSNAEILYDEENQIIGVKSAK